MFSSKGIRLFCGNALEVLPHLESKSVDLLLTDPPYGVGFRSNRGENFKPIAGDENQDVAMAVLSASCRVIKPFSHCYIFGRYDFSVDLPMTEGTELIWDKEMLGMGSLSDPWGPQHEYIQFKVFVPSKANRARGDGKLSARMRKGSVLRCSRKNSRAVNKHPTEKPVELLRQLIESSSCFGDTILDPFAGSGSTLEAAYLEGREAIGIEIDPGYAEAAARRLEAVCG